MNDQSVDTLEQAVQELRRRKREDPLKNVYEPHEHQQKVHRSRNEITLCVGGNRTGKTYCGVAEALLYCMGRSTYAETPEPPNTVWYVVPTSDTFVDAVKPIIDELIPPGEVEHIGGRKLKRYKFKNGSKLVIRSADQRQKRMVGASVDLAIIDEPISKTVYEEISARVIDSNGRILMVLTPVSEKQSEWLWIRDDLYIPHNTGEAGNVDVIHMPVVDEHGEPNVPHLTKAQVERMKRTYPDPQVRAARMHGEFIIRSGLVFNNYDPDVHLIDRFEIPSNWHRWMVCDPQYHRFAVLFFAADEQGNYYITDEYFSQDEHLSDRAQVLGAKLGPVDRDVSMYVDYANPTDVMELNWHFDREGVPIGAMELPVQKRVEKMILRAQSLMEPDPDRTYPDITGLGDVYGSPRLLIFNDLESTWEEDGRRLTQSRLLWELNRLTWDSKDRPDKGSAGGGDMVDALIYGCATVKSGRPAEKDEDWRRGLSQRDQQLWDAIERQNALQERGPQHLR